MIPLAVPDLSGNERKYLNECIDTGFVSSAGEFVDRFERQLAEVNNTSRSVAVNSGTSALHLSLIAAGVHSGDLVALADLTFIASANAIAYLQADPYLVDIDPSSWTMSPQTLAKFLEKDFELKEKGLIHKSSGRRMAAIMPVYTLGCPADMDAINEIALRYRVPVVADAAAAIGAKYKGRHLTELADFTAFSFNGNKTITTGGGGGIIAKNPEDLRNIKHISTTARKGAEYLHDQIGFNYRMTNVEAAIGCAQIERLESFLNSKKDTRNKYDQFIQEIGVGHKFPDPEWAEPAYWFSGIYFEDWTVDRVRHLISELNKAGIGARPFWMPIHLQPMFSQAPRTELVYSSKIWDKIITLPCSSNLTEEQLGVIFKELKRILEL